MFKMSGRMSRLRCVASTAIPLAALACSSPALAGSCEDLASLKLPDTTIETAQAVPAGDYTTADKAVRKAMPAFCRVVASVKDAPDSDIRIEMWLPKEGWAGVFHSNGNGGYGGIFDLGYPGMEAARQARLRLRDDRHGNGAGDAARWRSRSSAIRRNGRTGEVFRPM